MSINSFFIPTKSGERIKAWLYNPIKLPERMLVFCHGFTGNSSGLVAALADRLSKQYTICRFDFRGQGESDGVFAETTISRELEDLETVISYFQKQLPAKRLIVIGHSFGAAIAQLYSQQHHVDGLISLSGEGSLEKAVSQVEFSAEQLEDFRIKGATLVENWSKDGQLDLLKVGFLDDMHRYSTADAIKALNVPVLFLHGDADEVVPISQTKELYALAGEPKKLGVLKAMDHSYGFYDGKDDFKIVADHVADWIEHTKRLC